MDGRVTVDLFGNRHSRVGGNLGSNVYRLDSRFRGNDDYGISEQV